MTFEHAVVIKASASELFELTQDYGRRLEWDPFLESAELLGGAERCLLWLVEGLAGRVEPVVALPRAGPLVGELAQRGARVLIGSCIELGGEGLRAVLDLHNQRGVDLPPPLPTLQNRHGFLLEVGVVLLHPLGAGGIVISR